VTLSEAVANGLLRNADTLLWRRRGFSLIATAGRGDYTHAAKAGFLDGEWKCLEIREWIGGRITALEHQVARYPGIIDVFRPKMTPEECDRSLRAMKHKTEKSYNYAGIFWASLLHLAIVRIFVKPDTGVDEFRETWMPEFCSEATVSADQIACKQDPVPYLANRITEPSDISRTWFYDYQFTLKAVA
jgi:hypothetical protein